MFLVKKDKKHAKHIGVDKIRHINSFFCLHMSEKCSTFVGGMRISIAHIFSQACRMVNVWTKFMRVKRVEGGDCGG